MREILFKAKIKDSNEWVIGYYVYVDYLDKHYILVSEKTHDGFSGMLAMKQYEVDGDTICQCTGLKDKNGKLILENDVVEMYDRNTDYRWRAVVTFGNPNGEYTWGWQLKTIGECETNKDILCWIDMEESGAFCEVIGNIFDEGSENIGKRAEEN